MGRAWGQWGFFLVTRGSLGYGDLCNAMPVIGCDWAETTGMDDRSRYELVRAAPFVEGPEETTERGYPGAWPATMQPVMGPFIDERPPLQAPAAWDTRWNLQIRCKSQTRC